MNGREEFPAGPRRADFDGIGRSIEDARCLPAEAYTTERFLEIERRTLFSSRWICLGLVDDVPEPGDATPLEVAGKSVIMTRDRAGAVHVFHNYCRHRGLKILAGPVRGRSRFTCPYHAWTYALDGRLLRAPHFDGPGRHRAHPVDGLARVRSAVWHRLVFVNLSGDAQEFADWIAPLERRWARYDLSALRHAESRSCDIAANWKLAVENFIDYYHLPYVHKGLNSYSAMQDHYPIREGDLFLGQGNASYAPSDEATGGLPAFPGLDAAERSVTEAICLFPNLLVTLFDDNLRIILVERTAPAAAASGSRSSWWVTRRWRRRLLRCGTRWWNGFSPSTSRTSRSWRACRTRSPPPRSTAGASHPRSTRTSTISTG